MRYHTKGPWSVTGGGKTIMADRVMISFTYDKVSAGANGSFYHDYPETDEAKANARLIAAAPDLLAALHSVEAALEVDPAGRYMHLLATVRAAIARAEGRQP